MIQPPPIINVVQESATSISIHTTSGRKSMYTGTAEMLGFTDKYVVINDGSYTKIYELNGGTHAVIHTYGRNPLRVVGNTILIEENGYYITYDMEGNRISTVHK